MLKDFDYCFTKFKNNRYPRTQEVDTIKNKYWERYWLKIHADNKWNVIMIYSWLHHEVIKFVYNHYFIEEFKNKYTKRQFDSFKSKLWRVTNYYRLNLLLSAYFYNIKVWTNTNWEKVVLNWRDIKIRSLRIEIARKMTEFWIKWKKDIQDIFSMEEYFRKFDIQI